MYEVIETGHAPVKAWIKGVPVEDATRKQLAAVATLPFIHSHVAAMPDVHLGIGATVGSVIATRGAVLPSAVGVDIGCGMMAVQTSLTASQLPDSLAKIRAAIERAVPVGFAAHNTVSPAAEATWLHRLQQGYEAIVAKHPPAGTLKTPALQIGTLGGGNHFIELCLDEQDRVWAMLHSGSRGAGNRIGSYFIRRAREDLQARGLTPPERDLAWFEEGSPLFDDYVEAVGWAQDYAMENRKAMMVAVLDALRAHVPAFAATPMAVNCHHNYVAKEEHFGAGVWVTRKGAVRAGLGELGIIPGSMGARSFIVRGRGHPDSFDSCSHGAGRRMSRNAARAQFTLDDHVAATQGVECRKDAGVLDETPGAYKDIDAVMAAQADLVEIVHTLKQVLCVKG